MRNNDDKSDEYRIRRCTVAKLLADGWPRGNIRLEIPMSTNSSGGRVDVVLLDDAYTACIELKSGRDKLENDLLVPQIAQYKRAFDHCAVIADESLFRSIEHRTACSAWSCDNFKHVDLAYKYNFYKMEGVFLRQPRRGLYDKTPEPPALEQITPVLFPRGCHGSSRYTSVIDMAQILWADELRAIFGGKGTKSGLELKAKEEMSVKQFRPLFIEMLRGRPLNEWEAKFWDMFDGKPPKKTYLQESIQHIMEQSNG